MELEEQEWLLRIIRLLPPDRQQLLILKFVENLSNAEIGVIMGKSEGAIKSLYHRTLLTLKDHLLRQLSGHDGYSPNIITDEISLSVTESLVKKQDQRYATDRLKLQYQFY